MANNVSDFLNLPKSKPGSSTAYGESLLAGKIRRSEERAESKDKFGKIIAGFKAGVGFGNVLLDNHIKDADQNQQWQMGSYQDMLNRKNNIISEDDARITENISIETYLTNKYQAEIMAQLTDMYEGQGISIPHLKPYARSEALKMAKEDQVKYEALVKSSRSFPTFENFAKTYQDYSDTPRNLGAFFGARIKKWVTKETPESVEAKNKKEADALYGTDMFDKFKGLKVDIDAYDAVIGDGPDLVSLINKAKKESKFVGRIFEEGVKVYSDTKSDGTTITEDHYLLVPRYNPDGGITSETIAIGSTSSPADGSLMSFAEIGKFLELVKQGSPHYIAVNKILNSGKLDRPGFKEHMAAQAYLNANPDAYAIEWQDQKAVMDAFPTWFSGEIKNIMIDDPNNPNGPQVHLGTKDKLKDIWSIREEYTHIAKEMGLDETSMLMKFQELGIHASGTTYTNTGAYLTATQLRRDGFKDLSKMFTTTKQQEEYTKFLEGVTDDDSAFGQLFGSQLELYKDSDLDIIPLADDVLLEDLFPSMKGSKGDLYFNRDTNLLFFRSSSP